MAKLALSILPITVSRLVFDWHWFSNAGATAPSRPRAGLLMTLKVGKIARS
jgi:hypothetical protein